MSEKYDVIGRGYARRRQADPRIEAAVHRALGDATSVVNVGAGTGSYEPPTTVVAVEPASAMIAQRPAGAAPCLQASAEALPLPDDHADAAMAILTVHHWNDLAAGLAELRRVARRRVVILHWDTAFRHRFWLMRDYLQANAEWDAQRMPPYAALEEGLAPAVVRLVPVPVPHDCSDGFLGAYWRRPQAYLDPLVRSSISNLATPGAPGVDEGLGRLEADLASGRWHERNADLLELDEIDLGYRLLVAELTASRA